MPYLFLIAIALIWGSQYIFNALALQELTPFSLMVLRLFIGFLALSFFLLVTPNKKNTPFRVTPKLFVLFLLIGAVEAVIPFYLIGYGQLTVPSSITAIIMGFIPLMTLGFEHLFGLRKQIHKKEIIGLIVALIGLVILVAPSTQTTSLSILGISAILGASLCFSLALILMAKIPQEIPSLRATHFILMIYVLPLGAYWLLFNYNNLPTSPQTWWSVGALGIFASGLIYLLYLHLIRRSGASFTALSNYLVPVVGTFLGVIFLDETFSLNILIALLFITFALTMVRHPES